MDLMILASLLIFTLLIFTGVPIPFGFLVATIFLSITKGIDPSFLLPVGFAKMNSVTLLSLPFFIATGYLVTGGSIAHRLIDFVRVFVGRMKGGLGVVAVIVSCVFGAISGAAASSVIAIGTIMIPQMEKHGYPRGYSAALISSSAVLSTMIPPSLAMIMYAFVTGQSVAACFLATIGPALLLAFLFCIVNIFMVRKMPGIKIPPRRTADEQLVEVKEKSRAAFGAILLPVMILGGIYGGIMTPTEAAATAVFYALVLGCFIYREMKLGKVMFLLRSSAVATGTMILMTFFAAILSRIFTMEQVPQQIAEVLLSVTSNKLLLLLLINLFLIFIGMIMDELSGILMVTPLLYPVILKLGIHPIHFAAILGTNLGMGMMTPPMAGILYIGARTGNVTIDTMMKPAFLLIIFGSIPAILLTTFWEPLSLYLPGLAGLIH
ncbi:MAG: TRAP transporter large permease [Desulfobacterales bacterium]|nr:TRAP transporter large permease [Desulfobacterales bacterium]